MSIRKMQSKRTQFDIPTNPEPSTIKKDRNIGDFDNLISKVLAKSRESTFAKLKLLGKDQEDGAIQKVYDDDIVRTVSEEITDRTTSLFVIGDIIRAFRGTLKRREISADEFIKISLSEIVSREHIFREDIARLTRISQVESNLVLPFMNGGPVGENWNYADNGFYDWIDNKSKESILGIELGFKADSYGLEVSAKLLAKKKANPGINIALLIDGFVSILMQKPPSTLSDFEHNTIIMIDEMRKAGISVFNNDSWNPLSSDFLAANHIKLWIFDAQLAFFGGIGIESQFRKLLYDEMDSVQGPFVRILTVMALLLITNQKGHADPETNVEQVYQMKKETIEKLFLKKTFEQGSVNMKISMDIPGYIQDAQRDYIKLLTNKYVDEIFIMAPYFSDHKVAKALVVAANRLFAKYGPQSGYRSGIIFSNKRKKKPMVPQFSGNEGNWKRIHVIFPKKPEDRIIAEVSRYYAYYLRNNPIVETRQFYVESDSEKFEMLHAKQMVVVLRDQNRNWTKYVKFGGSYNPAGRAQNMWEINALMFNGTWDESDEGPASSKDNPIRNYLDNIMRVTVSKYSQPFPWGQASVKLSIWERIDMGIARHLWF
jgi:hypothetical protein